MRTYSVGHLLVTLPSVSDPLELATLRRATVLFRAKEKPLYGSASSAIDEAAYGNSATIHVEECTFNPDAIAALVAAAASRSTGAGGDPSAAVVPFPPLTARFDFLDNLDGKHKRTTLRNVLAPHIVVPFGRERVTQTNVTLFGFADENDIVAETDILAS